MTTVLLVEDNPTLLESIGFELEMRQYNVVMAEDGAQALKTMKQMNPLPDVIVSDIAMPDMDGYQFLEQVRANDDWLDIPFIFLTAFNSPNAIKIGKELGVDDYLTKPFKPDDLITAIENKLMRIRQIKERASRQLDSARRELINIISHELYTPMTAIYGGTEMLEDALAHTSDEFAHQLLGIVQGSTQRMQRVVNRVVILMQIDSGHLGNLYEQSASPVNLLQCVQAAVKDTSSASELARFPNSIDIHHMDDTLIVNGLQPFIQAAIEEGLHNAIKFAGNDQPVHISMRADAENARIIIQNEGAGLDARKLAEVWDRFVQVNRDLNEQQGLGLGLPMVKEIMRIHGGHATLESTPNKGTTFTLHFKRLHA